jgi:peptidoglycan-N-acetylglucosamine deacetylase
MVTWDVEGRPELFDRPSAYAQDILARVRTGSIILIHPMYRGNQVERDAIPLVLEGLARQGYRVVTVSKLLELEETR